jgi:hypothetical protein
MTAVRQTTSEVAHTAHGAELGVVGITEHTF